MTIRMLALLDGTLVDPATPIVRADDQGVVRGDGVFDAMLASFGRAHHLDEHLDRLATSARILQLPAPDEAGYRRAVAAILAAWDWDEEPEAVLRTIMTRGPEGLDEPNGWVMAAPLDATTKRERAEGVRVLILDRGFEGADVAPLPWLLPGAKSLSYGINMAAKRYAKANGADDVIFVTPSGSLLEGPTSSVVLDIDGDPRHAPARRHPALHHHRRAPRQGGGRGDSTVEVAALTRSTSSAAAVPGCCPAAGSSRRSRTSTASPCRTLPSAPGWPRC